MIADLSKRISENKIHTRLIDRLAYGHDASLYRVIPKAVVRPANETDIISLLNYANNTKTPITFRTAGTSLSGQSIGEGFIAETVRDWKHWKILDGGNAIQLEPGVIGSHANNYLSTYNRKIGPDPASINSCMIGGILANNASGMVCGVKNNAYHTLRSIRFIATNGSIFDTAIESDYDRFIIEQKNLAKGISECKKQIQSNSLLVDKIRKKYRIKNTMGYSMNAFLDFEHPLDIFSHLLIGSEGTLAFISSVILNTINDPPSKSTGLILFNDMADACASIPILSDLGASALELMDYSSLTTVRHLEYQPFNVENLQLSHSALLCEFDDENDERLFERTKRASDELPILNGKLVTSFTSNAEIRDNLWKVRKGLYPAVGALRKAGKSVITEDICVMNNDLPYAVKELHHIFQSYKYDDAVVFGHAKDGNLHFVASIDLNKPKGVKQFEGMMNELVSMTIGKFDGSLKAEHGTGRNMAPFVQTEWGGELYEIMWKIKLLADPNNILNPGVLLDRNSNTHLENLKEMPLVSHKVDLCVECGFCESVCPSRNITLTPRQRIVVIREMSLKDHSKVELEQLVKDFNYSGNQSCATDGLCALKCPVNIDTGLLIKDYRFNHHTSFSNSMAEYAANHFSQIQWLIKAGLVGVNIFGPGNMEKITSGLRKIGLKNIPQWNSSLKRAPKIRTYLSGEGDDLIYFPSCIHRSLGTTKNESVVNMMMDIAPFLGVKLFIPESINSLCCSMPFSSKGYVKAHSLMIDKTANELYTLSNKGQIPILIDISSCLYHIKNDNNVRILSGLKFVDIVEFFYEKRHYFDQHEKLKRDVLIHHTCASQKMHHEEKFISVVEKMASNVIYQESNGCCATAGDKGLFLPELTQSAGDNCGKSFREIPKSSIGVSTNHMCEMTMTQATGVPFHSLIELAHEYFKRI